MLYKSIILELLKQRPEMHERLRSQRTLLRALNRYSMQLKSLHESWKVQLAQDRPDSDPIQISSEAMELALRDLIDSLPTDSPPADQDTSSPTPVAAPIRNPSQPM
jgi:hypothetical protein